MKTKIFFSMALLLLGLTVAGCGDSNDGSDFWEGTTSEWKVVTGDNAYTIEYLGYDEAAQAYTARVVSAPADAPEELRPDFATCYFRNDDIRTLQLSVGDQLKVVMQKVAPFNAQKGRSQTGRAHVACILNVVNTRANFVYTNSGCKSASNSAEAEAQASDAEESLSYKWLGEGSVRFSHVNAVYNCEPEELKGVVDIDGRQITITETEKGPRANCVCPYDMNYDVKDLQAGDYTLVLKCGGKEPVSFNITLLPDHESGRMVIK